MRSAYLSTLLLCLTSSGACAQQGDSGQTTLSVRSTLVEVPALVKAAGGQIVFELTTDDFLLTDDGVPQHLTLDPDTDGQPLALAICVETGGAGAKHLADYQQLDAILDALVGNVEHRVAIIGFDSTPHLLLPFTEDTTAASRQMANLQQGNPGAAILDGVAFAVKQLQAVPTSYRRAILLLSETVDQGSQTTLNAALRILSDTNTTMYSFAFASPRGVSHEASKFNGEEPGPPHGCFSRGGADGEYEGHYSSQVLDCLSQLAPPIRLATMAFLAARSSLRTNTAESIAQLAGGEFFRFRNVKELNAGLVALSNDVPNYYVLSFHPTSLTPGLHALHLEIKDRPQLMLRSRSEYWMDSDAAR